MALDTIDINKDLMAASSAPIVLAILARGESYGYAILKQVQEISDQQVAWTDGMLYPVLHRLERLGQVKARWVEAASGRRRKYYRITPRGRTQLASDLKQWHTVSEMIRGLLPAQLLALKPLPISPKHRI